MKTFTGFMVAFCYLFSYPMNRRNSSAASLSREGPTHIQRDTKSSPQTALNRTVKERPVIVPVVNQGNCFPT